MNTNWSAQVAKTEWSAGSLNIYITYTNGDGSQAFTESLTTDSAPDDSFLQGKITDRLNQLNALGVYEQSVITNPVITSNITINPDTQAVDLTPISSDLQAQDASVDVK